MKQAIWDIDLLDTSQDKKGPREGVGQGFVSELTGVDGRLPDGQGPFPGFTKLGKSGAMGTYDGTYVAQGTFTAVQDFYPVQVRVGSGGFANGWVIRGTISAATKIVVELLYSGTWYAAALTPTSVGSTTTSTAAMDVAVAGRLIYVCLEGFTPVSIRVETDGGTSLEINASTGPGATPSLHNVDDSTDRVEDGSGNPWGPSFSDFGGGRSAAATAWQPPGHSNESQVLTTNALQLSASHSDEGRWPLESDLSDRFIGANNYDQAASADSDETEVWDDANNAYPDADTVQATPEPVPVPWDTGYRYVACAYKLYDERTGKTSALSDIRGIPQSQMLSSVALYPMIEIIYDSSKWTHAWIYRTLSQLGEPFTVLEVPVLYTERYIRLSDYVPDGPSSAPTTGGDYDTYNLTGDEKRAIYWYLLDDDSLQETTIVSSVDTFDEAPPPGGAAVVYGGSLIVSNIDSTDDSTVNSSVGEIRWSSVTSASYENFDPADRYVPPQAGDSPIKFVDLGDRVVGLSANRLYLIYRTSTGMEVRPMHGGYGVAGQKAATSVASQCIYVTDKGLAGVDAAGALQAYRAFDYILQGTWKTHLADVSLAYDGRLGAVFGLNPTLERSFVMWLTTSKTSELADMNFAEVASGIIPGSSSDVRRAMFIRNDGTIFYVDADETRDVRTFLEMSSGTTTNLTAASDDDSATTTITMSGSPTIDETNYINAYVYVTSGTLRGQKALITAADNTAKTITVDQDWSTISAGDTLAVSPVYFRVVTGPIGLQDDKGFTFGPSERWRQRYVRSVGCHFEGVSGSGASTDNARFYASVFKGDDETEKAGAFPVKNAGTLYRSVVDGPSTNYSEVHKYGYGGSILFVGVEVVCSDADWRLLSMRVEGHIDQGVREDRSQ